MTPQQATEQIPAGTRVASARDASDLGLVERDNRGSVEVRWDDGTYCRVSRSELTIIDAEAAFTVMTYGSIDEDFDAFTLPQARQIAAKMIRRGDDASIVDNKTGLEVA